MFGAWASLRELHSRYEDLLCKQLLRLLANIPPEVTSEIDMVYLKGDEEACKAAGKTPQDVAKGEKAYTFLMDWSEANKDRGLDRSPNSKKLFDQAIESTTCYMQNSSM